MIEPSSVTSTPTRSSFKKSRVLAYLMVVIVALLLIWQGPKWFGQLASDQGEVIAAPVINFPNLTDLRTQVNSWQKLWQDSRFTELQSLSELLPASGGNFTPFEKQIPAAPQ